ncbi:unnamed protein product [Rotaria socialis]|uniref:Transient receptor potential cation channel subfamily A member 1 n=2 Tax=Rotaria socialis TaxID=392032 RepID=A0A817RHX4_9BILA|nr:unnamed protein product [Rotaria socialis]CAF3329098.1 unnamed protein product [Rotaria socialis]CAF3404386.1 unnamed protein product [Rotaria socialis]
MMGENSGQPLLLSNPSVDRDDVNIIGGHLLVATQSDELERRQSAIPKTGDWNTSMVSQVCREGDIDRLREFKEYSLQTLSCGKHAAEIADRLDLETGLSPLHHAARYQQLDVCLMLLSSIDFRFGINIKDANGRTPMHSAFRPSNLLNTNSSKQEKPFDIETDFDNKILDVDIWQDEYKNKIFSKDHPLIYLFALASGNVNARDKFLLTPLHYAVARNNLAGVKQLIKLNANIEASDRQDIHPLHLACKEGFLSIVEYLIECGAKIDAIDADECIPLHYACAKGHLDIIKLIKSKDEINFQKFVQMKTNAKATCLHLAVQHGNTLSVQYILSEFHGDALEMLVNDKIESFGTPLHIAAKFCDPSMINLLHQFGADPLILNSHHQSSLHIASAANRLPIVQKLLSLSQSSLLEIKDRHGQTALSVTTQLDIVNELIASGADISSIDNNHMNVLMIAVSKGQKMIVEHLLLGISDQLLKVFDQVTKKDNRTIFLVAAQTGSIDMCSSLLTHPNVRWDTIDKQRMNAFHIAARNNHSKLIEFLCEKMTQSDKLISMSSRNYSIVRANSELVNISQTSSTLYLYIDAQNEDGKTPLHLAAEQGHTACVEILLKYGVDVLLPNYLGQLALHVAIQNGHSECVDLLIKASARNMVDFESALSRRQSPLITACRNGFVDIVRLLLSQNIGLDHENNNNDKEQKEEEEEEENPLEIAIKYRQIETIHVLLEHPNIENWLTPVRKTKQYYHQTPLRDMIRYIPQCAKHAFDKLILTTNEIDLNENTFERITYKYEYIDDYFLNDVQLYTTNSNQLYRNHPFIIALDSEHHSLLEHPLARQLILRKWKLYRPFFYATRILTFLLLLCLTFYVLTVSAPNIKSPKPISSPLIKNLILPMRWIILILAGMNLFKILLEIIFYRGLRVPFAQLFSMISFLTSIMAFIPYENTDQIIDCQWQLAALSTLLQWFNIAFMLRSVPFIGNFIVMFQSILLNFFSLIFVILPLLIAFTIATKMIFFNHSAFLTITTSMHKLTAMLIGEYDYETFFFSKPTFLAASLLFIPFIVIMTFVFMNLLLGLTIGDIHISMENARAKANAYRIRELIYIESTVPSIKWLRSNIIKCEFMDNDSILKKHESNKNEENDYNENVLNQQIFVELGKLLDILNVLCSQAKQVLETEINLDIILKQLLSVRKAQDSTGSSTSDLNTT